MTKTTPGNFFEDFSIGQVIRHATPRTITVGDVAVYTALYAPRFAVQSSDNFSRAIGYPQAPVDDLLVFHIVFGRTVADISLNAIANLGYADCRFLRAVYPGDTLLAETEIIGLRENSNRQTGVVHVRTKGINQKDETVLEFIRWVMVRKRDESSPAPEASVPEHPAEVSPDTLGGAVPPLYLHNWEAALTGSKARWHHYEPGEKIDHVDGMTVEEAEHMLATRLYQNTAKVHFNQHTESKGRFGRRLVYGGHVISIARALTFNGLANAFHIAAINGGRHSAPLFAGGTVYAWSEIRDRAEIASRSDIGALRIVTRATCDLPCGGFPAEDGGPDKPGVILELDYWAILPR